MESRVLILIVMDNGLIQNIKSGIDLLDECLNPCCNGQWSHTYTREEEMYLMDNVLILIVMDNGLILNIWDSR